MFYEFVEDAIAEAERSRGLGVQGSASKVLCSANANANRKIIGLSLLDLYSSPKADNCNLHIYIGAFCFLLHLANRSVCNKRSHHIAVEYTVVPINLNRHQSEGDVNILIKILVS